MKFFITLFSFLILTQSLSAEVAIEGETEYISLVKGVYKDVKLEDLPDESIFKYENKDYKRYADIVYDNERKVMRFKPKREGSFTLRFINKKRPDLIMKQIKVTVQKNNLDKLAKEIKELLREIEGIEIKILNNKVVVDGYILLAKDMNRIAMVLAQYPEDQVASLVRLSPLTKRKIAERIEAEIDNPNIYVTVINDFYMLEGSESYAGERERAEKIAQAHISDTIDKFAVNSDKGGTKILPVIKDPNPIINNILPVREPAPQPKKIIQVVVHYVELSKNYNRGFNFSWAPSIGEESGVTISSGSEQSSDILSTFTATISNLLPKLNWAREHGYARVLDTMNIVTEEGQKGTVNSFNQIERIITSIAGTQTISPRAEIKTVVTPTLDPVRRDNVRMNISITISEITGINAAGADTSGKSIETIVSVRDKQTAALAGLLRSASGTDYNKSPASNQNTLFRLGASKDLSREHSQFVIFATPIIKANASQGVEKVKKKFRLDK